MLKIDASNYTSGGGGGILGLGRGRFEFFPAGAQMSISTVGELPMVEIY